ncbi:hypothetical protein HanRHA438_Chr16g0761231 [Helianthus annuus]|nr:hypothetical protein HanRHA438_Chr16g0761231 [Helianthus annuus]
MWVQKFCCYPRIFATKTKTLCIDFWQRLSKQVLAYKVSRIRKTNIFALIVLPKDNPFEECSCCDNDYRPNRLRFRMIRMGIWISISLHIFPKHSLCFLG